jgi:hypothetical protein
VLDDIGDEVVPWSMRDWGIFVVTPLGLFGFVLVLWFGYGNHLVREYSSLEDAANYADSFGHINSLFSGLALAASSTPSFSNRTS